MRLISKDNLTSSFDEFAEIVPGGFYWFDLNHKLRAINSFALKTGNAELSDVIGKTPIEMHPRKMAEEIISNHKQVITTGKQLHCQERIQDFKTGETVFFDVVLSPLFDENNEIFGVCGISTDVTELKRLEEETIQQRDELAEKDELKKEFIKGFAHDVNLPISALLSNLMLLKKIVKENKQLQEFVDQISDSVMALNRLFEQMRDVMMNDQFYHTLYPVDVDFFELIETEIQLAKASVSKKKSLKIIHQIDHSVPREVYTDPRKIQQILRNLLSNAVKYTKEGQVILEVKVFGEELDQKIIKFIVSDTGMGIAEDERESIYKLGKRLVSSYKTNIHGTGLGLYIIKTNVEILGGSVDFSSIVDKGSTFWIELPAFVNHQGKFIIGLPKPVI